jgi:5-methyltetrahydropteroyltriglutamate--homocysteine methyltransferase
MGGNVMASSANKIRVSHAGTLPRPEGLKELVMAEPGSVRAQTGLAAAVGDVVRKQADLGIDIVNDGEFSKVRGFFPSMCANGSVGSPRAPAGAS